MSSTVVRTRPIGATILVLALVACSASPAASPSEAASASASASAGATPYEQGKYDKYQLADGRLMYLKCNGSGSPTILLEAGGGSDSSQFPDLLLAPLVAETQTCVYDRAGTGVSMREETRRLLADVLADLDELLTLAEVDGPFLLAGTSFGGQVTYYHALIHPERTAGMVIIDSDWPSDDPARDATRSVLTEDQWADLIAADSWDAPDNNERVDFQATLPELAAAFHPLDIPIRILTATRTDGGGCPPEWDCALIVQRSIEFQEDWLQAGPNTTQVFIDAGHNLAGEAPQEVAAEILIVLEEIRANGG